MLLAMWWGCVDPDAPVSPGDDAPFVFVVPSGATAKGLSDELAFAGLGAAEATSGAFADNPSSNAVSRRLGYEPNGSVQVARDGVAALHHNYRMSRERWEQLRSQHAGILGAPIELEGTAALRALLDRG